MRHRVRSQRLSRNYSERRAMLRSMATSLLLEQRIKTTLAKAKEVRRLVERLITLSKDGKLSARRRAYDMLGDRSIVATLFKEIGPLFKGRAGGYTRILRLARPRSGDGAQMAFIELTEKRAIEALAKPVKKETKPEEKPKPKVEEKPKPERRPEPEKRPEERPREKAEPEEKAKEEKKPARGFFEGLKKFFKKDK